MNLLTFIILIAVLIILPSQNDEIDARDDYRQRPMQVASSYG